MLPWKGVAELPVLELSWAPAAGKSRGCAVPSINVRVSSRVARLHHTILCAEATALDQTTIQRSMRAASLLASLPDPLLSLPMPEMLFIKARGVAGISRCVFLPRPVPRSFET